MYTYTSDNIGNIGFIDKDKILEYVSEEDIFQHVFGFKPVEFVYVRSIFRIDKRPGCWFERGIDGRLLFRDFAYGRRPIDCFEAVKIKYKLNNFYEALKYIYDNLIKDKSLIQSNTNNKPIFIKKDVVINIETRNFLNRDGLYWSKYGISKENLISDKVFPISRFILLNTKNGDIKTRLYETCYAYTEFENNRKKLYFPFRQGSKRFITNCKKNDIGNINNVPSIGRQLIITKSYKDCRVLTNQGKHSIWIQNEGMVPDNDVLIPKIKGYSDIIVWYDNDQAGINASIKLSDMINSFIGNKSKPLWLPESLLTEGITDPSDLIAKKSLQHLTEFIHEKT